VLTPNNLFADEETEVREAKHPSIPKHPLWGLQKAGQNRDVNRDGGRAASSHSPSLITQHSPSLPRIWSTVNAVA
jgi:hypothetical protein